MFGVELVRARVISNNTVEDEDGAFVSNSHVDGCISVGELDGHEVSVYAANALYIIRANHLDAEYERLRSLEIAVRALLEIVELRDFEGAIKIGADPIAAEIFKTVAHAVGWEPPEIEPSTGG